MVSIRLECHHRPWQKLLVSSDDDVFRFWVNMHTLVDPSHQLNSSVVDSCRTSQNYIQDLRKALCLSMKDKMKKDMSLNKRTWNKSERVTAMEMVEENIETVRVSESPDEHDCDGINTLVYRRCKICNSKATVKCTHPRCDHCKCFFCNVCVTFHQLYPMVSENKMR